MYAFHVRVLRAVCVSSSDEEYSVERNNSNNNFPFVFGKRVDGKLFSLEC